MHSRKFSLIHMVAAACSQLPVGSKQGNKWFIWLPVFPRKHFFPPLWGAWHDEKWLEIANFKQFFHLQITHLGTLPQLISRWDVVMPLHVLCYRGLGTSQILTSAWRNMQEQDARSWPYPQNGCRHSLLSTAGPSHDLQPLPGLWWGRGVIWQAWKTPPLRIHLSCALGENSERIFAVYHQQLRWLWVPGCWPRSPVRKGPVRFQRPPAQGTAWPLSTTSGAEGSGTAKWCPAARCERKKMRNPPASPKERGGGGKGGAWGTAAWGRHCPAAPQCSAKMEQGDPAQHHCWAITSSLTPFSIISGKPSRLGNNSAQASRGYFKIFSLSLSEKTAFSFYAIWKFTSQRRAVGCWRGPSPALLPNSDIQSTKDKTAWLHQS